MDILRVWIVHVLGKHIDKKILSLNGTQLEGYGSGGF